jgi:transcriptional regulator with XRE-family HTH domain
MTSPAATTPGAFGPLLRTWRQQRKASQLQLAIDSGISQRHLSFLESGRAKPSTEMVMQLAEVLDVPLRERNALLLAAGYAPFYHQRSLTDREMAPVLDALTHMLNHHEPFPAVAVDRDFNLLLQNRAFETMLTLLGDPAQLWAACCPNGVPNLLRLTFHPRGARPFIRNFEQVGALLLVRAYRESLPYPESATHRFLAELRLDTSIPRHWHTPSPQLAAYPVLPLALGDGTVELSLFSMISTIGTPHDVTADEIRVETFFPADKATENLLRSLANNRFAD